MLQDRQGMSVFGIYHLNILLTFVTGQAPRRLLLRRLCVLRRKPRLLRGPQVRRVHHNLSHTRRAQPTAQNPTRPLPPTTLAGRSPQTATTHRLRRAHRPDKYPQNARRRRRRRHPQPTRPIRRPTQPHPNHQQSRLRSIRAHGEDPRR